MHQPTVLPNGWPNSRKLAVSVSIMLEGYADDSAPGLGPMGNPLRAGVLDLQARSWAQYGPETGIWRLLDVLDRAHVSAVVYTSGLLAERYPEVVKAIVDAGHVVAAHGWTQDVIPAYQNENVESADIVRCVEVLTKTAGMRPRGWISPRCTPSERTAELLIQNGFDWHADYFSADLPRILPLSGGQRLTAIPFTMEINDLPHAIRYGNDPQSYVTVVRHLLDGYVQSSDRPTCMDITVHAHVFGRPPGAIAFAQALKAVQNCTDLAFLTNHQRLADAFFPR